MAANHAFAVRWVAPAAALLMIVSGLLPPGAQGASQAAPLELIIAPETFIEELLPLMAWRESQGLRMDIATPSQIHAQIGGRDIAASIQQYIAARKAADPRLEYLLLFGDDPLIPARLLQVANATASPGVAPELRSLVSDFYYGVTASSFINTSNLGPYYPGGPPWWGISDDSWRLSADLHVGRVPVSNESEAAAYVSRLLAWEQAPPAGVWQQRALLGLAVASPPSVGSWTSARQEEDAAVTFAGAEAAMVAQGISNISLRDYPNWPAAYDPFEDALDDSALLSEWNLGASLVVLAARDGPIPGGPGGHYGGDGTTAIFPPIARPSSLDVLANGDQLPVYVAAYGSSANFSLDNDTDIERALFAPAGGAALAIGFTGATGSGTAPGGTLGGWRLASLVVAEALARPGPVGDTVDRARERFVAEARSALGAAFDANSVALRTAVAGLALLGDPAALPWMGAARTLDVSAPAGVPPHSPSTFEVSVMSAGVPVPNATIAVLDDGGDLVAQALTDASGVAQLTVLAGARGSWTLVASAAGFLRSSQILAIDTPPTASVITPGTDSSVGGTMTASGSAGDPDAGDVITAVEVSLNGGPWQAASGGAAWSFSVDTLALFNGPNYLAARASDGIVWGPPAGVTFVVANPKAPTVIAPYPQLFVDEDTVGVFSLDLPNHFRASGPGALLTAFVEGADRVRASVRESDLVLTPDPDFNGAVVILLTVSDSYGGTVTVVLNLGVLQMADPPLLTVGGDRTVLEGGTVNFDPRAFDPDGTVPTIYLDSGPPGATITGWQAPRASAGNYVFVFAAADGLHVTKASLTVVVEPYNAPPSATLTGASVGEAGRELPFSAEAAADADGDDLTFEWGFGDGQHATGPSTSHVYAAPGSFAVTLTVSDGRQSVVYTHLVVVDPYRPPGTPPMGTTGIIAYASTAVILLCVALSAWMLVSAARRNKPSPPAASDGDPPPPSGDDSEE